MIARIDLQSPDAAAQLDAALAGHGFVSVTNHGVPAAVIAAAFDAAQRFFALPEDVKQRWHIDRWPLQRGFDPIGWQALDPAQPPDLKESFYVGAEAHGPNQWPDEARVPGFRAAVETYSGELHALALRLLGLFAEALGLAPAHLQDYACEPMRTTRLLHYPPLPDARPPGQIGCGAHTDWGALTLLAQDGAGGLQVQTADGRWLDVPPRPGDFVVNVGDLTQRWTNDRWRSTVHRVVPGRERWSIAYFFDLDRDASIAPLAACCSAANPPRYGPLTAGEHLAEMYRRTTVAPPPAA